MLTDVNVGLGGVFRGRWTNLAAVFAKETFRALDSVFRVFGKTPGSAPAKDFRKVVRGEVKDRVSHGSGSTCGGAWGRLGCLEVSAWGCARGCRVRGVSACERAERVPGVIRSFLLRYSFLTRWMSSWPTQTTAFGATRRSRTSENMRKKVYSSESYAQTPFTRQKLINARAFTEVVQSRQTGKLSEDKKRLRFCSRCCLSAAAGLRCGPICIFALGIFFVPYTAAEKVFAACKRPQRCTKSGAHHTGPCCMHVHTEKSKHELKQKRASAAVVWVAFAH